MNPFNTLMQYDLLLRIADKLHLKRATIENNRIVIPTWGLKFYENRIGNGWKGAIEDLKSAEALLVELYPVGAVIFFDMNSVIITSVKSGNTYRSTVAYTGWSEDIALVEEKEIRKHFRSKAEYQTALREAISTAYQAWVSEHQDEINQVSQNIGGPANPPALEW